MNERRVELLKGDCLAALGGLESASIDALVTDPPAGISFMGKDWDGDKGGREQWVAWLASVLVECRRVLKPGSHALVWAIPRTAHWTATALEDAGFEVRDVVVHLFGTGFPKSLDVSKAIDKAAGADRIVIGPDEYRRARANKGTASDKMPSYDTSRVAQADAVLTAPVTDAAKQWAGWGTALKPAAEHWILARVPLEGTVAGNVLAHGTGALNVDGCRVAMSAEDAAFIEKTARPNSRGQAHEGAVMNRPSTPTVAVHAAGRWPANVVLSGDAPAMLDEQSGDRPGFSSGGVRHKGTQNKERQSLGAFGGDGVRSQVYADNGGASRFFYCPKASTAERSQGLAEGEKSDHPTVKPLALMRWLVRLVAPPGGKVLDPFMGSGTTGMACEAEGFGFVGIEQDEHYYGIAARRIEGMGARVSKGKGGAKAEAQDEQVQPDKPKRDVKVREAESGSDSEAREHVSYRLTIKRTDDAVREAVGQYGSVEVSVSIHRGMLDGEDPAEQWADLKEEVHAKVDDAFTSLGIVADEE